MTAIVIGRVIVGTHIVTTTTYTLHGQELKVGPDIVDVYHVLSGPCQAVNFQLHPN